MLINLIPKSFEIDDYTDDEISAIQNLIHAHGECKHILISDRKLFKMVIDNTTIFGLNTRRFADAIMQRQFEFSNLQNIVNFYVEVHFGEIETEIVKLDQTREKLSMNHKQFIDSNITQKTVILCEDLTDSKLYELFSYYFSQQNKLQILKTNFEAQNGGGANTKRNFDSISQSGKFCLCIIDNDKKHPHGQQGETSKKFNGIKYLNQSMVYVIDAHEAESMIPLKIISDIIIDDKYPSDTIDAFDMIKEMVEFEPTTKDYFDHKNGFSLEKISNLDDAHGDYWRPIIKSTNRLNNYNCINKKRCPEECSCFQINGFGDQTLTKSLERMSTTNISSLAQKSKPELVEKWLTIGKIFFSWCCAPNKAVRV